MRHAGTRGGIYSARKQAARQLANEYQNMHVYHAWHVSETSMHEVSEICKCLPTRREWRKQVQVYACFSVVLGSTYWHGYRAPWPS